MSSSARTDRAVDAGYFDITKGGDKPAPFLTNDGKIEHYFQHIKQIEAIFDDALSPFGIRFDAEDVLRRSENSLRGDQWISKFIRERGEGKGKVYPNQILTTVDILKAILENPGQSGICVGATMCGKTGTSNNCNWLPLFLQLLTGEPYILITLIPRNKSLADQTSTERASFLSFYGDIELRYGGEVVSLKRYFTQDLYHRFPPSLFNPSDQEANSAKSKANVIRRVQGSMLERLEKICRTADYYGIKIIFVVDESHYGAAAKSIQDLMLNSPSAQLINGHHGHVMVGFSATPWEHMNLNNVWEVRHRLGYNGTTTYVGFNFLNGKPIDPTVTVQQPNVLSFAQLSDRMRDYLYDTNLEMVVPGWYKSKDSYDKAREAQAKAEAKNKDTFVEKEGITEKLPASWVKYKDKCHSDIAAMLNYCLVEECPHGGRGALLRFINDNKMMNEESEFYSGLKQYLHPSVELYPYIQGVNEEAVERFINNQIPKDQPYVILVTGSGRMGDLFPPEVKYGFEFARDIELTPLQQGIPGRMTGHKKGSATHTRGSVNDLPLIVLSHRPKHVMDEFIRSKGMAVKRPNNRVTVGIMADDTPQETRGAGEHNVTLWADDMLKDPILVRVLESFERVIISQLKRGTAKTPTGRPPQPRLKNYFVPPDEVGSRNVVPIWSILSEDILNYIEKNYERISGEVVTRREIELLRPAFDGKPLIAGKPVVDDQGYSYAALVYNGYRMGRVGFRNAKFESNVQGGIPASHKQNIKLPNDTLPVGGESRNQLKQLDVQLHVLNTRTGWKLAALRLRAVKSFKSRVIGGTLPNDRSYTKGFRTEDETKALKKRLNGRTK